MPKRETGDTYVEQGVKEEQAGVLGQNVKARAHAKDGVVVLAKWSANRLADLVCWAMGHIPCPQPRPRQTHVQGRKRTQRIHAL